ncbi:MAG: carboxypeptidase-like regulatory domain-containing protein [Desulfuromonadales bacterium]|nr:carboxypeptidase-like regulatory domain-containing protein [Desulfuromonadales bacterium]
MSWKGLLIALWLAVLIPVTVGVATAFPLVLSGTVRTSDGSPLSGADVEIVSLADHVSFTAHSSTNAAGGFSFSLTPGSYRLRLSYTQDGVSATVPLRSVLFADTVICTVDTDTVLPDVILPLVSLRGKVLDSFGVPVKGASVAFGNGIWGHGWAYYSSGGTVYTDSSGNYHVSLYPYGDYRVAISPPGKSGLLPQTIVGFAALQDMVHDFVFPVSASIEVPAGDDVAIRPLPNLRVIFESVTGGGTLTAQALPNLLPPANTRIPEETSFQITSTAIFTGQVEFCLNYDEANLANRSTESALKLAQYDGRQWEDITTRVDVAQNMVCGVSDPFFQLASKWSSL